MTRAEILDCLTDRPCDVCRFHESGRCERWDCVFEEKPDDCEDAISRQAVLDTLDTSDRFMDEERTVENYKALLKECYEVLPSVTPKQKVGHWEWVQYDYNPKLGNWHCSECRCIVAECVEAEKRGGIPLYKCCPQCGAKMEDTE